MRCEFCDEEVAEGALACPRCGGPLSKASPPLEAPPAAQAPPGLSPTVPADQVSRPSLDNLDLTAAPTARERQVPPASPAPPARQSTPAPANVPLAPLEEDFIAMAEERVAPFEEAVSPSAFSSEVQALQGAPSAEVAAVADQSVPPGAHVAPERIMLDDALTGGYKGEQAGGSSVAGAGEQTGDDPFGLNITETAPVLPAEYESGGGFSHRGVLNVIIMILALLVAGAVVFVGVYYGFLHKGLSKDEPPTVVKDLSIASITGDNRQIYEYATQEARYPSILGSILMPYEKVGTVTVKDFEAETVKITDTAAVVEIKKFTANLLTTSGTEVIPILEIATPQKLPTTINLIRRNGKWLVTT